MGDSVNSALHGMLLLIVAVTRVTRNEHSTRAFVRLAEILVTIALLVVRRMRNTSPESLVRPNGVGLIEH